MPQRSRRREVASLNKLLTAGRACGKLGAILTAGHEGERQIIPWRQDLASQAVTGLAAVVDDLCEIVALV